MGRLKIVPLEERIVLDAAIGHVVAETATAGAAAAGAHFLVIPIHAAGGEALAHAAKDNVVVSLYEHSNSTEHAHNTANSLHSNPNISQTDTQNTHSQTQTISTTLLASSTTLAPISLLPANVTVTVIFSDLTSHNNATIHAGDILSYTITVTNTGNDVAFFPVLTNIVPANTTYIPGTLTIVSGPNQGHQTDAIGDDFGQISGSTITFFLGTAATPVQGGFLLAGSSTSVSFEVHLNANAPAGTVVTDTASTTFFYGETNNESTASGSVAFSSVAVPVPPPVVHSSPPPIPVGVGPHPGSTPPASTPITLNEIAPTAPLFVESLPHPSAPVEIPAIYYEQAMYLHLPASATPVAVTPTPLPLLPLTLQPYTLERFEPSPFQPFVTEASAPIFTETTARTGAVLLAAAAITDISYPGLNRRAEFAIPVRFSMSAVVVIPESEPVTNAAGGKVRLRVSLSSLPTTRVVVAFKSANPDLAAVTPNELIFTPTNWNTEQYVTVVGKGGSAAGEDYQILVMPAQSSDPNYNELETDPVKMRAVA